MTKVEFSTWLKQQIDHCGWSQADLAKAARLNRASISHIINRSRLPGPEILTALASALRLPPEMVFRKAGILPDYPVLDEPVEQAIRRFELILQQLPPDDQRELIAMVDALANVIRQRVHDRRAPGAD